MKLATTTADFKEYTVNPEHIAEYLHLFKGTGFRYIDANFYGATRPNSIFADESWLGHIHAAAEAAQCLGFQFVQAHSSDTVWEPGLQREQTMEYIRRQFRACEILGIPQMVVHAVYAKGNTWAQFSRTNLEIYQALLPTVEETGVTMLLENGCRQNCWGMYYLTSAQLILDMIHALGDHPLLGVCWDVGHAHMQGVDQYAEIMELGARLKGVHIHDNLGNQDVHLAPYTGNCAYDPIIKGLVDSRYTGYFTMEAYSIPSPKDFLGRKGFTLDGQTYERLLDLPLPLKQMSERLLYETGKYMLEQYDCFEE